MVRVGSWLKPNNNISVQFLYTFMISVDCVSIIVSLKTQLSVGTVNPHSSVVELAKTPAPNSREIFNLNLD